MNILSGVSGAASGAIKWIDDNTQGKVRTKLQIDAWVCEHTYQKIEDVENKGLIQKAYDIGNRALGAIGYYGLCSVLEVVGGIVQGVVNIGAGAWNGTIKGVDAVRSRFFTKPEPKPEPTVPPRGPTVTEKIKGKLAATMGRHTAAIQKRYEELVGLGETRDYSAWYEVVTKEWNNKKQQCEQNNQPKPEFKDWLDVQYQISAQ